MDPYLVMTFENESEGRVNLTVREADPAITGEQVSQVMDTVINENIFTSAGGDLVDKLEAKLVQVTETALDLGEEE